jgi:hypothetical protein
MIPNSFKPYLWSYDLKNLDLEKNKKLIILNILNLGSKKSVDDLFEIYGRENVHKLFTEIPAGNFNKKSYNFWQKVF